MGIFGGKYDGGFSEQMSQAFQQQNSARSYHTAGLAQGLGDMNHSQGIGGQTTWVPSPMYSPMTDSYQTRSAPLKENKPAQKPQEKTMFKQVKADARQFMIDHKSLIYGLVAFYLLDHFVFEGKFKAKLMELANRLIGTLEKKVDQIGIEHDKK